MQIHVSPEPCRVNQCVSNSGKISRPELVTGAHTAREMASFNSGSNCFITAKEKVSAYPCNPNTVRGEPTIISFHPKEKGRVIYPNGKYIVVRNLDNPGDTFIYRGHNANTTVAKFSPNGFWVASADVTGKVKVWAWDNPEHNMKMETTVQQLPHRYDVLPSGHHL